MLHSIRSLFIDLRSLIIKLLKCVFLSFVTNNVYALFINLLVLAANRITFPEFRESLWRSTYFLSRVSG